MDEIDKYDLKVLNSETRFNIFKELKPTFEEFFKVFPESNPKEIISTIKTQLEYNKTVGNDIQSLYNTIEGLLKEKKNSTVLNKEMFDGLDNKIKSLNENNKKIDELYKIERNELKSEIKDKQFYLEENIKLKNFLFSIYNKLIERFSLIKGVKLSEELQLEEKDFTPNLFENEEIKKYINFMITLSSDEKSLNLLREVAAYSNMIIRLFFPNDVKDRFQPINVFKKMKSTMEHQQFQAKKFKDECMINSKKIDELNLLVYKLNSTIKHQQDEINNLKIRYVYRENKAKYETEHLKNKSTLSNKDVKEVVTNKTLPIVDSREGVIEVDMEINNTYNNNKTLRENKYQKISNFEEDFNNIFNTYTTNPNINNTYNENEEISSKTTNINTTHYVTYNEKELKDKKSKKKANIEEIVNKSQLILYRDKHNNSIKHDTIDTTKILSNTNNISNTNNTNNNITRPYTAVSKQSKRNNSVRPSTAKFNNYTTNISNINNTYSNELDIVESRNIKMEHTSFAKEKYSYGSLKFCKNKDKLEIEIANKSKLPLPENRLSTEETKYLSGIVQHTNKLSVYRNRLTLNDKDHKKNRNVFISKEKIINKTINKLNKFNKKEKLLKDKEQKKAIAIVMSEKEKDIYLKETISNNIDSLIKNLEDKDLNK